jgi:hypothetical protein
MIKCFQVKMKLEEKGAWKAIPMPHSMFTGSLDSAVCGGIEVLTDYTISKGNKNVSGSQKDKSLKRKNNSEPTPKDCAKKAKTQFNVTDIPVAGELVKPPLARSKKKKKNKNKPAVDLSKVIQLLSKAPDTGNSSSSPESDGKTSTERKKDKKLPDVSVNPTAVTASGKTLPEAHDAQAASSVDMSEWKELFVCDEILRALADKGFTQPTPIQKLSLPAALKGRYRVL